MRTSSITIIYYLLHINNAFPNALPFFPKLLLLGFQLERARTTRDVSVRCHCWNFWPGPPEISY